MLGVKAKARHGKERFRRCSAARSTFDGCVTGDFPGAWRATFPRLSGNLIIIAIIGLRTAADITTQMGGARAADSGMCPARERRGEARWRHVIVVRAAFEQSSGTPLAVT